MNDEYIAQIAQSAYFKWEAAGKPEGRAEEFWLEAENEAFRKMLFEPLRFPFVTLTTTPLVIDPDHKPKGIGIIGSEVNESYNRRGTLTRTPGV